VFCGVLSNKVYVPRRISGIHDHERNQAVASPRLLEPKPPANQYVAYPSCGVGLVVGLGEGFAEDLPYVGGDGW
jgi:hypothetical protein